VCLGFELATEKVKEIVNDIIYRGELVTVGCSYGGGIGILLLPRPIIDFIKVQIGLWPS
jgi:hypothetical protein